jgi:hypothetical protein
MDDDGEDADRSRARDDGSGDDGNGDDDVDGERYGGNGAKSARRSGAYRSVSADAELDDNADGDGDGDDAIDDTLNETAEGDDGAAAGNDDLDDDVMERGFDSTTALMEISVRDIAVALNRVQQDEDAIRTRLEAVNTQMQVGVSFVPYGVEGGKEGVGALPSVVELACVVPSSFHLCRAQSCARVVQEKSRLASKFRHLLHSHSAHLKEAQKAAAAADGADGDDALLSGAVKDERLRGAAQVAALRARRAAQRQREAAELSASCAGDAQRAVFVERMNDPDNATRPVWSVFRAPVALVTVCDNVLQENRCVSQSAADLSSRR